MALFIQATIFLISSSFIPLVVRAGVPNLTPEGFIGGLGSLGIVDLLTDIPILSKIISASFPLTPLLVISTTIK
jgi:hypothetical protein